MSKKTKSRAKSFFDGMEDFETNEKIELDALKNLPDRAPAYSAEDLEQVEKLLKNRDKKENKL